MVARNQKNDRNFLDIYLHDISAEYEVDPIFFLGLDSFLMNVLSFFERFFAFLSVNIRKMRTLCYEQVTVLFEKENSILK